MGDLLCDTPPKTKYEPTPTPPTKPRGGHSQDQWYFVGAVEWFDGSGKGRTDQPIDMPMLCSDTDEGAAEIKELSALMSDYLAEHGDWCEGKPHEGWYAHRKVVA